MIVTETWAFDRTDRVRACLQRHTAGPCRCGFDGVHATRVQVMEARHFRAACACAWYGPVRRSEAEADDDRDRHRP